MFDEQALMDRVDGDLEFLDETIAMLDEDCPSLLDQIEAARAIPRERDQNVEHPPLFGNAACGGKGYLWDS